MAKEYSKSHSTSGNEQSEYRSDASGSGHPSKALS